MVIVEYFISRLSVWWAFFFSKIRLIFWKQSSYTWYMSMQVRVSVYRNTW